MNIKLSGLNFDKIIEMTTTELDEFISNLKKTQRVKIGVTLGLNRILGYNLGR